MVWHLNAKKVLKICQLSNKEVYDVIACLRKTISVIGNN